ncbi:MAG TPA: glycosyltransferase family 39 protein [Chitinophagaceae bacterium]|nr:glycosyltransferase family 39 protein [Chitinophagaceae bacterium]
MDTSGRLFSDRIPWLWLFVAAGALIYIPFLGGVHLFDWDEINFAEISREMMVTGDYLRVQVDYKPFFEKPPFFFWLQSLSMHVFGINEFAARLPNALCGIIVLVFLYKTGTHWINRRFGILWPLAYLGSILPTLYHKSGIIDPWFNLFIFASIVSWMEGNRVLRNTKWFVISGCLCGLAVLTKGPVALLLIGLTIVLMAVFSGKKQFIQIKSILLFIPGCIGIGGLWFGIEWLAHGPTFISAFFKYQVELLSESVAGHKGFPGYHFVIALIGIFPASLFALGALRKKSTDESLLAWHARLLMMILTAIVLIIFTIVQSEIVHYSSLAYYPVTFLSAWFLSNFLDGKIRFATWQKHLSGIVIIIILSLLFGLPYLGLNIDMLKSKFSFDAFTRASLDAPVGWGYFDFIPAIWFLGVLIISYAFFKRSKFQHSLISLFIGTAVLVNLFLVFFIGKIEHYSQRAAVEFCKTKSGQNVEIETLGYRSYVPFYYAAKPQPSDSAVQKEHYYILKTDKRQILDERPELKVLYEKNGFIFLEE